VVQSELRSHESFLTEMEAIFEEFDSSGSGHITWERFREYLHDERVQAYFASQQLDASDPRELFNLLDIDEDGEISVEDFILGCKRLRGQAKSTDMASLLQESKRISRKSMRKMRKLEEQLCTIAFGLQGIGLPICPDPPGACSAKSSNWLLSPGSVDSSEWRATVAAAGAARPGGARARSYSPRTSPRARSRSRGADGPFWQPPLPPVGWHAPGLPLAAAIVGVSRMRSSENV